MTQPPGQPISGEGNPFGSVPHSNPGVVTVAVPARGHEWLPMAVAGVMTTLVGIAIVWGASRIVDLGDRVGRAEERSGFMQAQIDGVRASVAALPTQPQLDSMSKEIAAVHQEVRELRTDLRRRDR